MHVNELTRLSINKIIIFLLILFIGGSFFAPSLFSNEIKIHTPQNSSYKNLDQYFSYIADKAIKNISFYTNKTFDHDINYFFFMMMKRNFWLILKVHLIGEWVLLIPKVIQLF